MNAPRDDSFFPAKLAILNTDTVQGQNLVPIVVNASGAILVNETATISFTMQPITPEDDNFVRCWIFQGSDGKLYPAVATSAGELLIEP